MSDGNPLEHGWWAVAFIDLLGQKDAFMRADFVPERDDPQANARLFAALHDSVGVIRGLHTILEMFQHSPQVARIQPLRSMGFPLTNSQFSGSFGRAGFANCVGQMVSSATLLFAGPTITIRSWG